MTPENAAYLLNFLLPTIENESQITRKVIGAILETKRDYKPDPNSRTALELAWHIAASDIWFLDGICNGQFNPGSDMPAEIKSVANVLAWYDKNFPAGLARLKALPAEKLAQVTDFLGFMKIPAVGYLMLLNNHAIHHRGQLATYLRPMGSKVPSIYGGSFDEPMKMEAGA
jgi:uncharacterized damage-inducible protein DinB